MSSLTLILGWCYFVISFLPPEPEMMSKMEARYLCIGFLVTSALWKIAEKLRNK